MYIYLLQTEDHSNTDTYKIGTTSQVKPWQRISKEPKYRRCKLYILLEIEHENAERDLIEIFKRKYGKPCQGREYFNGSKEEMIADIIAYRCVVVAQAEEYKRKIIDDYVKAEKQQKEKAEKEAIQTPAKVTKPQPTKPQPTKQQPTRTQPKRSAKKTPIEVIVVEDSDDEDVKEVKQPAKSKAQKRLTYTTPVKSNTMLTVNAFIQNVEHAYQQSFDDIITSIFLEQTTCDVYKLRDCIVDSCGVVPADQHQLLLCIVDTCSRLRRQKILKTSGENCWSLNQ